MGRRNSSSTAVAPSRGGMRGGAKKKKKIDAGEQGRRVVPRYFDADGGQRLAWTDVQYLVVYEAREGINPGRCRLRTMF